MNKVFVRRSTRAQKFHSKLWGTLKWTSHIFLFLDSHLLSLALYPPLMWWKEERRWLDDHKLKRLVQYYFPAPLESPTRSQIIWLSNVKVVYGVEMTVNLRGHGKVEVPSDIQTKRNVSYWEWIKVDLFFSVFHRLSVNKTNSNLKTQKLTCFLHYQWTPTIFPH